MLRPSRTRDGDRERSRASYGPTGFLFRRLDRNFLDTPLRGKRAPIAGTCLSIVALLVQAGCGSAPKDSSVRRPAKADLVFASVEIGGIARQAATLSDATQIALRFEGTDSGTLAFHVAKRSESEQPAHIVASFSCDDLVARLRSAVFKRKHPTCAVHWGPKAVSGRWQPCEMRLDEPCRSGTLTISPNASPKAGITLSEPLAYGPRNSTHPDVYLFVADTARADRLQPYDGSFPIGQHLATLGADSVVFLRARSPSSWTRPSTATLLTGIHPDRHGVHGRRDMLPESLPLLPETLRQSGYYTFALSANANILPLWGFARGFDEFHDVGASSWASAKTGARELFDALVDELETGPSQPGFYYVHLMDPHAPYQPTLEQLETIRSIPEIEKTFPHEAWEYAREREVDEYEKYLGELLDLDNELGRFIEYLRAAGRYENSIIVVVSDHGEEFRDHGLTYHGTGLFEEVLRVPAMIKLPGSANLAGNVDAPIGLEDVTPTLLTALDVGEHSGADGRSAIVRSGSGSTTASPTLSTATTLFRLAPWLATRPRPQFATLKLDQFRVASVVDEPWKLIEYHHMESPRLFNLAVDPHERDNLAEKEPQKLAAMRLLLASRGAEHDRGWHLLFCGGRNGNPLAVRLKGATDELVTDGLEPEDVVSDVQADGSRELRLTLGQRTFEVEELGRLVKRAYPDEERVTMPHAPDTAPLALESLDDAPLSYTLGVNREIRNSERLDLAAVGLEATVAGHEWIECPLSDTDAAGRAMEEVDQPYIRIWLVTPPRTAEAADVSPEIVERLRQLGYTW